MSSLAEESALLVQLRELAERGQHREVLSGLERLPPDALTTRTAFALLAAESHGRLGEHTEAERWATRALTIARTRGERHAELRARNYQAAIAIERGDVAGAEQHLAEALGLARALGDHAAEARCLNNLGIIANLQGDRQGALTSYQLALAAYQQAGLVRGMAETQHNIGISWHHIGDYRRALNATEEAIRLASQVRDEGLTVLAVLERAELHLVQGDAELATAELARAEAISERLPRPVVQAEVLRLKAAVARVRGDVAGAVASLQRAAGFVSGPRNAHTLAEIERDLGTALAAAGDTAGARAARQRAIALYRQLGARRAADEIAALVSDDV